jgi:uncharacterized membrane protein
LRTRIQIYGFLIALFCWAASASPSRADSFTIIDAPVANQQGTVAYSINNSGQISGYVFTASGSTVGFIDQNGMFRTIVYPGAIATNLYGINNAGQVVGTFLYVANVVSGGNVFQSGFTLNNGVFTVVNPYPIGSFVNGQAFGINDLGQIVGPDFVFSSGQYTQTSGPAFAINNAGVIVGNYFGALSGQSFVDDHGVVTSFDIPGATATSLTAINNLGQIAGSYTDASGVQHGFVDTNGVFQTIDVPGAESTNVLGMNDKGQLVGYFYYDYPDRSGEHAFLFTPTVATPEPPTVILVLSILLLWLIRRATVNS